MIQVGLHFLCAASVGVYDHKTEHMLERSPVQAQMPRQEVRR